MSYQLYEHQRQVVDKVVSHLAFDDEAFISGSVSVGKTYIALAMADEVLKMFCEDTEKVYIAVSISALIPQFIETARTMGIEIDVMAAGVKSPCANASIVVAMEQTLISRADKLEDNCFLYIRDEVHLAYKTTSQKKVLKKLKVSKFVGMSGSLFDKKGEPLDTTVESFEVKPLAKMIEDKDVKKIIYIDSRNEELTEAFAFKKNDSETVIGTEVIKRAEHIMDVYFKQNQKLEDKKTIWFCPNTVSADKIASVLRDRGVVAYSYHSSNIGRNKELQEIALKSFKGDKLLSTEKKNLFKNEDVELILCNNIVTVNSLSTGFSVDNIEVGVLTAPITSKNAYIQRAGRIIRKDDEIKEAYLVDMHGSIFEYGKLEKLHTDVSKNILKELKKRDNVDIDNMDVMIEHLIELEKYDGVYSKLELKDAISLFRIKEVDETIDSISDYLALTMSLVHKIHGEKYETETFQGKKKIVKNWYNSNAFDWIIEDFVYLYEQIEDDEVKKAMSSIYKSQCRGIVNNKKNIYGLKFCYSRMMPMLDYYMNIGLYLQKEDNIIEKINKFYIDKEYEEEPIAQSKPELVVLDDDEIPF